MKNLANFSPYKKGYLSVGDGHKLYFELYGNPAGKPAIYLHGGPGGGFSDKDKSYFDRKIWNVILFDQRGAGKSRPSGSLKANTTAKLVEDINQLLNYFKIKKALLFGGSWGSTLALSYAIKNPERVSSMILRGIFLSSKKDYQHLFQGGIRKFHPEVWQRFISPVPQRYRKNPAAYYFKQIRSKNKQTSQKFAREFSLYELSILKLKNSPALIGQEIAEWSNPARAAAIELHYLTQNCFLPENYILKNTSRISHIPVSIVHGRYDLICPPENAYILHKKLPGSRMHFVIAGHSSSDVNIKNKLISELKYFAKRI